METDDDDGTFYVDENGIPEGVIQLEAICMVCNEFKSCSDFGWDYETLDHPPIICEPCMGKAQMPNFEQYTAQQLRENLISQLLATGRDTENILQLSQEIAEYSTSDIQRKKDETFQEMLDIAQQRSKDGFDTMRDGTTEEQLDLAIMIFLLGNELRERTETN